MRLEQLEALVRDRARRRPKESDTARLLDGGVDAVGKKLLEEAAEAWMAARFETPENLKVELSQVLYHLVCLMVLGNLTLEEVLSSI